MSLLGFNSRDNAPYKKAANFLWLPLPPDLLSMAYFYLYASLQHGCIYFPSFSILLTVLFILYNIPYLVKSDRDKPSW